MNLRTALLLAGLLPLSGLAVATSPATPQVTVSGAWIRWLPGDLPAAAYATLRNDGARRVRLTGAASTDYANVMLHRSSVTGGTSRMQDVDGLDIGPGASVELAPGGYHLMLMQARHAIAPGDTVHLRLRFADGSSVDAAFPVRPANSEGPRSGTGRQP
jgi:copper(I)-binding protein